MIKLADFTYLMREWTFAHSTKVRTGEASVLIQYHDIKPDWRMFWKLVFGYSQRGRYYHNLQHLVQGLRYMDKALVCDPELTMAWFFHDYVYKVGSKDNEIQSASVARAYMLKREFSSGATNRVQAAILQTANHLEPMRVSSYHDPVLTAQLCKKIIEVDLSIFFAQRDEYAAYADNIAKEFTTLYTDDQYVTGRVNFLRKMYDHFGQGYLVHPNRTNAIAMANIRYEIDDVLLDH